MPLPGRKRRVFDPADFDPPLEHCTPKRRRFLATPATAEATTEPRLAHIQPLAIADLARPGRVVRARTRVKPPSSPATTLGDVVEACKDICRQDPVVSGRQAKLNAAAGSTQRPASESRPRSAMRRSSDGRRPS